MVTGGAGFIGSHVVDRLIQDKYEVIVFDNLSQGLNENIEGHLDNPQFTLQKEDIKNKDKINNALIDAYAVINLAAIVSVIRSIQEPELVHNINVTGNLNLLNTSLKQNVKKFIFASSAAIYGANENLPLKIDYPFNPLSPYAASKVAGEAYCQAYHETYGLNTIILRFMNIYGPRSIGIYSGVITKFSEAITKKKPLTIYGDGEQTRDFTYVTDAVDTILLALNTKEAQGKTFNIGTGKPTSINQLANLFKNITNNPKQQIQYKDPRKGEIKHSYADITKTTKILGHKPKINLETGIQKYLKWYQKTKYTPTNTE